jgi:hypothetical protein
MRSCSLGDICSMRCAATARSSWRRASVMQVSPERLGVSFLARGMISPGEKSVRRAMGRSTGHEGVGRRSARTHDRERMHS